MKNAKIWRPVLRELERTGDGDVVRIGRHCISLTAALHELRWRPLALAQARPAMDLFPLGLEALGEALGVRNLAGRVHADVHRRARVAGVLGAEQLVEGSDAVGLGGAEPAARRRGS